MKYKVCDKCGEIVAKTGFISSNQLIGATTGQFARCNNKSCRKSFSQFEYEKLKETEL